MVLESERPVEFAIFEVKKLVREFPVVHRGTLSGLLDARLIFGPGVIGVRPS